MAGHSSQTTSIIPTIHTPDSPCLTAMATSGSVAIATGSYSNVSSRRSSVSSNCAFASDVSVGASGSSAASVVSSQTHQRARLQHTNDPLSRQYPKPNGEINVAEALAREPKKWSLNYWTKNARDMPPPPSSSRAQLEKVKRELRQAQGEMASHWTR